MCDNKELADRIARLEHMVEVLSQSGISSGRMQIQSISIQVSNRLRCNAGCKFCISRTTHSGEGVCPTDHPATLDFDRLKIGLDYAARGGAYTAILTGKADPLQEDSAYLLQLIKACRKKVPSVDMHTNGLGLRNHYHELVSLAKNGLTMITFSIAHDDQIKNAELMGYRKDFDPFELVQRAHNTGLLVRCSLVLNKSGVHDLPGIMSYIATAKKAGAHQIVIRELWLPEGIEPLDQAVWQWNQENKVEIAALEEQFWTESRTAKSPIRFIKRLPWGTPIFEVDGMNVTFARCEESYNGGTLKSLVHLVDGHGYMDWSNQGASLY